MRRFPTSRYLDRANSRQARGHLSLKGAEGNTERFPDFEASPRLFLQKYTVAMGSVLNKVVARCQPHLSAGRTPKPIFIFRQGRGVGWVNLKRQALT